jgi:sialidase-1
MDIQYSTVFKKHSDGFNNYRIPSTIVSKKGTILVFAEARKYRSDQAQNDIVVKRSTDSGKTWKKMITVASNGKNSLNNPQAVVIQESGRILLMFQDYPHPATAMDVVPGLTDPGRRKWIRFGFKELRVVQCYETHSDDDGITWTKPTNITKMIKKPEEVTTIASGPGIGIQLRREGRKGRIIMPFNEGPRKKWKVFAVYSDDNGETWLQGAVAPEGEINYYPNEVQMVELADGTILLNGREHIGNRKRVIAISKDFGESWSRLREDPQLIDPRCQGSIIRYTDPLDGYKSRLLFANPASENGRYNGTVYISYDEGKTWPVSKSIYPKEKKYAYSCLTILNDLSIGCIFEADSAYAAKELKFARFDLEWLTDGKDKLERT